MSDMTERSKLIAEAVSKRAEFLGSPPTESRAFVYADLAGFEAGYAAALSEADRELGEARDAIHTRETLVATLMRKLSEQAATIEAVKAWRNGFALAADLDAILSRTDTTEAFGASATVELPPKSEQLEAVNAIKAEALREAADAMRTGNFIAVKGADGSGWVKAYSDKWLRARAAALTEKAGTDDE